jgi:hypothetical protein
MVNDADGSTYPTSAVYLEVSEPERLVWHEKHSGVTTTTTFVDLGGSRTEVRTSTGRSAQVSGYPAQPSICCLPLPAAGSPALPCTVTRARGSPRPSHSFSKACSTASVSAGWM